MLIRKVTEATSLESSTAIAFQSKTKSSFSSSKEKKDVSGPMFFEEPEQGTVPADHEFPVVSMAWFIQWINGQKRRNKIKRSPKWIRKQDTAKRYNRMI